MITLAIIRLKFCHALYCICYAAVLLYFTNYVLYYGLEKTCDSILYYVGIITISDIVIMSTRYKLSNKFSQDHNIEHNL